MNFVGFGIWRKYARGTMVYDKLGCGFITSCVESTNLKEEKLIERVVHNV